MRLPIIHYKDPNTGQWHDLPAVAGKSAYQSAVEGGYTGSETAFYADLAATSNKANKYKVINTSLLAASWAGSTAPWTYTLNSQGTTATNDNAIKPGVAITSDQLKAFQSANIQDGGQSTNTITLKAWGSKPSIDIPITILVGGETI